jgi:hypothetical protein
LVELLEQKLEAAGAAAKVIPPAAVIAAEFEHQYEAQLRDQVHEVVAELVDLETIHAAATEMLRDRVLRSRPNPRALIDRVISRKREMPCRGAVQNRVAARLERQQGAIKQSVREALLAALHGLDDEREDGDVV